MLSESHNRKSLQDVLRFALTNPCVPPNSLGETGTHAWVKSAYELGQSLMLKRAFARMQANGRETGERRQWEFGLDLQSLPVRTVALVLKGLMRGKYIGTGDKAFETARDTLRDYRGSGERDRMELFRAMVASFSTFEAGAREFHRIMAGTGLELREWEDEEVTVVLLRALRSDARDAMFDDLQQDLQKRKSEGRLTAKGWNWSLRERLRAGNPDEAMSAMETSVGEMRGAGVLPDQETFQVVLLQKLETSSGSKVDVQTLPDGYIDKVWETSALLGIDPSDGVWNKAFGRLVRMIDQAPGLSQEERRGAIYTAYENAVRAGARVTVPLAKQVVDRLVKGKVQEADSKANYARVNNVRSDLGAAMDESEEIVRASSMRLLERDEALRSIYMVCLAGAIAGSNVVPDAVSLLDEMRRRHITLDRVTAMRLTIDLMDRAEQHHDAFRAYSYVRALDETQMREDGYMEVIQHFIRLVLPKSPWPAPKLTFEFLRDMRDVGVPPQAKVYTMMVNEYTQYLRRRRRERASTLAMGAVLADSTTADERIASNTIQTIQKIHSIVKLDSFLDVDLALLTALMDAYNQLQLWSETFELWNEIVMRHRGERASEDSRMTTIQRVAYRPALSVILDACGYSGNLTRARKIWEWAHGRDMIRTSYGNWKSWIECLCRCGKLSEACDIVRGPFQEEWLKDEAREGIKVDEDELPVLEMLVRFSWRDRSDWTEVKEMLVKEFPEQWELLKERKVVKARELDVQQKGL